MGRALVPRVATYRKRIYEGPFEPAGEHAIGVKALPRLPPPPSIDGLDFQSPELQALTPHWSGDVPGQG